MKYEVQIRRIVREDTLIMVDAANEAEALEKAKSEATNVPAENWECYDCEYWNDDDAVILKKDLIKENQGVL